MIFFSRSRILCLFKKKVSRTSSPSRRSNEIATNLLFQNDTFPGRTAAAGNRLRVSIKFACIYIMHKNVRVSTMELDRSIEPRIQFDSINQNIILTLDRTQQKINGWIKKYVYTIKYYYYYSHHLII